jgi:glycosyltransferase involved in cell wall biosynthesis
MPLAPRVSIVIGAYRAAETIGRCLDALRCQTYRDFEVIVVDSSPDGETSAIVAAYPEVRLERSKTRLYCHQARNRGVALSRGELLACLDADVFPRPDWLATLVAAYDPSGHVLVGAIACHGRRWSHLAFHLCKFSKYLPTPGPRSIDIGPTANLLVARSDFADAGGLRGDRYAADVAFSRALLARGRTLTFVGTAVVEHQHTQSVTGFLKERFIRGKAYANVRTGWLRRLEIATYLVVSILPIRLSKVMLHVTAHCHRAGELHTLLRTWPLVLAGHAASLLGESVAYVRALLTRTAPEEAKEGSAVGVHEPLR